LRLAKKRLSGENHLLSGKALSSSRFPICLLVFLLCFTPAGFAQTNPSKTVLVLYDGGREFAGVQMIDRGIESTLSDALSNRVTIFREYMDLTRIGTSDYEQVLRDFYRSKYSRNRPDVIVAIRGRPFNFVHKYRDELFPGVPLVSAAMDVRQLSGGTRQPNLTGTTLRIEYKPTLALAIELQPETKHLVVVLGASPNDRALEDLIRGEFGDEENGVDVSYLSGLAIDSLLERVRNLPPRTVLLFASFTQDAQGRSFLPNDVLALVSRAASVPTYINSEDVLGAGAVGGDLIDFAAVGKETARLTLQILQGESAANIAFTDATARAKKVDARQLELWGIGLSRVPRDTIVLNRTPTMWEAYRWRIVGGVSLIILQSALIATLLLQRRRRRIAEENLRVSEEKGRAAVLEERDRMARDMHDTLAQGFTGVIIQLEAAQHASEHASAADMDAHIHRASDLARQSLAEARRSIRALRPQALEQAAWWTALDGLTKQITAGTRLRAEFTTNGRPRALTPFTEDNLLHIHQEILTNALKHSSATAVKATLSFTQNAVSLEVQDDGKGFDLSTQHDGLGLIGIRERVNQMDGDLTVESRVGIGTRICVVLPHQS
jgi:signal transduction histidine kinase